jgi:GNAT superfamily N-acetyltransferase
MTVERINGRELDAATAQELADLVNTAQAVDGPHLPPVSGEHERLRYRYGWDGDGTPDLLVDRASDGTLVGLAEIELPRWDNLHVAGLGLTVHPAHRSGQIGDDLLAETLALLKEKERTTLISDAWVDSYMAKFWDDHGFTVAMRAAQRRLRPAQLDWEELDRLHVRSLDASEAYDTVEIPHPAPAELLDQLVDIQRTMNDAPIDDLDIEDDVWSDERFRGYEDAMRNRRIRLIRLVAQRRSDGELGGFTTMAIEDERPHLGFQEDTAVVGEHRGHRLGMRLKIEMLQLLREREPGIVQIDTWNAESNSHMIAVNDAIGCFVVGRGLEYQRDLS